jgi:hypothetical protein
MGKRVAGIDDILDHEHVAPFDITAKSTSTGRSSSRTRSAMKTKEPRNSPTTTSFSVPANSASISCASASTRAAMLLAEISLSIT